jgi:RelA/SpoT family protein
MAEWVKRQYTKGEIDKAGALMVPWWKGNTYGKQPEGFGRAAVIVFDWRASHAMPLNVFQKTLRGRAQRVEPDAIIAQRIKRFSSIMNKLARESKMKLSQMQDLGGCRAIFSKVESVYGVFEMYRGPQATLPISEAAIKCYDYIQNPKDDGYRGIHIVGRYQARVAHRHAWDGQRIEIQLRTQLQHAFATTVETVTTFTREPLKFGAGPAEWRRFFSLVGSALAIREGTPPVAGTPSDESELIAELRETAYTLKVSERLNGWSEALRTLPRKGITKGFKWLLLVLNVKEKTTNVTGYSDRKAASDAIAEIEKSKNADLDAVLVWVSSIHSLREAYPNYYADTKEFLRALDTAIASAK